MHQLYHPSQLIEINVMKKTNIVCTIGPKTESEEVLSSLLDAGTNVMRLNFSHGDYEEHGQRIKNLRAVLKRTGQQGAILLDTKSPETRTMKLENGADVSLARRPNLYLYDRSERYRQQRTRCGHLSGVHPGSGGR
ncbi:MAG: pyruvate kinase [Sodalis sp. (in: enterobacteria)]|uniref:pyruvate kinase n=1 Tax=Sodalis sp. (in: enterobacteria) TaxID=1898979 RepID=UPI003F2F7961